MLDTLPMLSKNIEGKEETFLQNCLLKYRLLTNRQERYSTRNNKVFSSSSSFLFSSLFIRSILLIEKENNSNYTSITIKISMTINKFLTNLKVIAKENKFERASLSIISICSLFFFSFLLTNIL